MCAGRNSVGFVVRSVLCWVRVGCLCVLRGLTATRIERPLLSFGTSVIAPPAPSSGNGSYFSSDSSAGNSTLPHPLDYGLIELLGHGILMNAAFGWSSCLADCCTSTKFCLFAERIVSLHALPSRLSVLCLHRFSSPPRRPRRPLVKAWDIYYHVFRKISRQLTTLKYIELRHVAPALPRANSLQLAVPGTYRCGVRCAVRAPKRSCTPSAGLQWSSEWILTLLLVVNRRRRSTVQRVERKPFQGDCRLQL